MTQTGRPLYDLFLRNNRRDIDKWHHYFSVYERYFPAFMHRPISFLEIGVYKGGSLRMWRDFFGPQAKITGIDINPECMQHRGENIEVYIGDQADPEFLARVAAERGPFDIILDDGGHTAKQQIIALETLTPHVKEGGLFIVEDTHTSLWADYMDHPLGITFLDVATRMAERLTWWHKERSSFDRYSTPYGERKGNALVPAVTRAFFAITFYDSMVVFEKARVGEPLRELR
ncbi:MAG: class I SAM-dependent methyltransferase [Caulobacterales bacterium]